jgi:hypothetical protein
VRNPPSLGDGSDAVSTKAQLRHASIEKRRNERCCVWAANNDWSFWLASQSSQAWRDNGKFSIGHRLSAPLSAAIDRNTEEETRSALGPAFPLQGNRAPLSKCLSAHKPSRNSSLRLRELGADVMRQQRPRHPRARQMESLFLALLNWILERRIGWREGRERASVISAPLLDEHRVSGRCAGRQ